MDWTLAATHGVAFGLGWLIASYFARIELHRTIRSIVKWQTPNSPSNEADSPMPTHFNMRMTTESGEPIPPKQRRRRNGSFPWFYLSLLVSAISAVGAYFTQESTSETQTGHIIGSISFAAPHIVILLFVFGFLKLVRKGTVIERFKQAGAACFALSVLMALVTFYPLFGT